jgi:hypothetical protein
MQGTAEGSRRIHGSSSKIRCGVSVSKLRHRRGFDPGNLASGIARAIRSRNRPSAKQAAQGESVLAEAIKKGFRPTVVQSG